jgi:predicted regulator of Ras-like GTPase activity (Roadblock/LC7/MglB family)/type II secretory pathway predicted ATPase ExeA
MAEADDIRFILLIDAHLDFPNILNYLCTNLELPVAGLGLAVERRSRLLLEAVATRARHNQSVALLVDDAQQLAAEVLLHLQEFVETPAIPSQRLQVVLAALPDFARTLDQPELCRLRDSIQVHCHLERLSELETGLFIEHQLKLAGHAGGSLLPPAAIERINFHCKGVPRAIALLCDTIFLFASLQSERAITPELVDTAAQTCFLGELSSLATQIGDGRPRGTTAPDTPPGVAAEPADFDLALSDFDFSFDSGEQTMRAKQPVRAPPVEMATLSAAVVPPVSPLAEARAATAAGQRIDARSFEPRQETAGEGIDAVSSVLPRRVASASPLPASPPPVRHYRLDLVNVPRKRDQQAGANELRPAPLGRSPQAGPHINAKDVEPRPAELLFRDDRQATDSPTQEGNEPNALEHLRSAAGKYPWLTHLLSPSTEQENPMSRLDNLNKVLKNLQNESPGVEASALISEDGLMIASALPQDLDETRVAGMTATLLNLGTRAAVELRRGDVQEVIVRGEHGYSVMISAGRGALLLVLTNENSKLGLIFFDMREAIKAIKNIL